MPDKEEDEGAFTGIAVDSFLDTEAEWHYFAGGVALGLVGGILVGAGIVMWLSRKR